MPVKLEQGKKIELFGCIGVIVVSLRSTPTSLSSACSGERMTGATGHGLEQDGQSTAHGFC